MEINGTQYSTIEPVASQISQYNGRQDYNYITRQDIFFCHLWPVNEAVKFLSFSVFVEQWDDLETTFTFRRSGV